MFMIFQCELSRLKHLIAATSWCAFAGALIMLWNRKYGING